jgi:hypothetical protein
MRAINNSITLGLGCDAASAAESRVESIVARETLPCEIEKAQDVKTSQDYQNERRNSRAQ